jgi:hypothetical protein
LGKHQVTGKWCLFVDEDLSQLENPYQVLADAKTFNPETLPYSNSFVNLQLTHQGDPSDESGLVLPPLIKDCIQSALRTGCDKGVRNMTAHILATELRNAGVSIDQSLYLIQCVWNPRNRPPLSGKELERVVTSAYRQNPLQYGCRPGGKLGEFVQCLGSEQCVF